MILKNVYHQSAGEYQTQQVEQKIAENQIAQPPVDAKSQDAGQHKVPASQITSPMTNSNFTQSNDQPPLLPFPT
jgi:hypothetical protein